MSLPLIENRLFEKADFTVDAPEKAEYDQCRFVHCNFTSADLSGMVFTECIFEHCNMGMAELKQTSLKDVVFRHCKLTGVNFSDCKPFLLAFTFEHCHMDLTTFYRMKIGGTHFTGCQLREADFTEAELSNAIFSECDLTSAVFDLTNLEKADLRTAHNYMIDPQTNRITKARFSLPDALGLFYRYDIEVE